MLFTIFSFSEEKKNVMIIIILFNQNYSLKKPKDLSPNFVATMIQTCRVILDENELDNDMKITFGCLCFFLRRAFLSHPPLPWSDPTSEDGAGVGLNSPVWSPHSPTMFAMWHWRTGLFTFGSLVSLSPPPLLSLSSPARIRKITL